MQQTTVAIADSHPVLCEGLSVCLSHEPDLRIVGTASSAREATELVAARQPEVVVLDGDLGGPELITQVRSTKPNLAVVVLTAPEDVESAADAMRVGATGFVLKIAPVQDLVAAVRSTGRGEMWISPPLLSTLFADMRSPSSTSSSQSSGAPGTSGQPRRRLSELTEREVEIIGLLVEGMGHKAIAQRLHLAVNTVRTHTRNIQMKFHVHSNLAAVAIALEEGLRPT